MKTPSLESLACAKRANVATWRQLAAVVALVCVSTACEQANGTVMLTVLTPQLEVEPNNTVGTANPLTVFSILGGQLEEAVANGVISPSDVDFYSFPATNLASGDSIFVVLLAKAFGSTLDGAIGLFDASGNLLVVQGNGSGDPVIAFPVPSSSPSNATYNVAVVGFAPAGGTRSTGSYTVLVYHCKPGGANNVVCR